jgi:hypothetical protein
VKSNGECSGTPQPTKYTLTVTGGTGSGQFAAGTATPIVAAAPASGKLFDKWTGDTAYVASTTSASTSVTMPEKAITLTATYKDATATLYALNVTNGTGDGNYASGTLVTITANTPPSGQSFDKWTGDTSYLVSATAATTTLTMPSKSITLTAAYKGVSQPNAAVLTATLLPNPISEVKAGSSGVQLVSYKITNSGTENIFISGLGFTGDFSKEVVAKNALYINDRNVGGADSANSSGARFSTLEFPIMKGESFTFTLKGDIAPTASAGTRCFALNQTPTVTVAKSMVSGKSASLEVSGTGSCLNISAGEVKDGIVDGSIVRAFGDIDVYIIKLKNGKAFKRLVLSPSVFRSYGHLKWENIIIVDAAVLDDYTTSNLVYVAGSSKIWLLEPQGDTGKKSVFTGTYDPDSVYEVNATDLASYKG